MLNSNLLDEIYYDSDFIDMLKSQSSLFQRSMYGYRSNWRILHIDGFEGGREFPIHTGELRTFFNYPEPEPDLLYAPV